MFTRHTSPATRKARRDLIAAQAERPALRITLNPAKLAAVTVSLALVAVSVVESLPL